MTSCFVGKKIGAVRPGPLELFPFVVLAFYVWVNIYFVSKISQELLYLESWNLVHMTNMTSCIVGKKIGAVGPVPLELFPFVVLAIGGGREWQSVVYLTSPGRPTEIGLQLGKACYPCSR